MIDEQIRIKRFNFPKLNMNHDRFAPSEQEIEYICYANVRIPKNDIVNLEWIVELTVDLKNRDEESILNVSIRGIIEIVDKSLSKDEIKEQIKNNITPKLYNNLKNYIDRLIEFSNLEFVSIPEYNKLDN